MLDENLQSQLSLVDFEATVLNSAKANYNTFEEFVFDEVNYEDYISFSQSNGMNRILLSFALDTSDTVYGITLE